MDSLTLIRPDDWHLHLRDGPAMADVLRHTARRFGRAVIMPNLRPPVVTVADAAAYRADPEAFARAFWAREDVRLLTPANERRAEHVGQHNLFG